MKATVVTIVLLAALIVGSGVPGLAQEGRRPAIDGWSAMARLGPPARMPEGGAALPWFPPERAGPGAIITVTTTDDELNVDGDCSLREAIQAANANGPLDACVAGSGDDTVLVPGGTYLLTIPGANDNSNTTGDLDILDNLVLTGDGAEVTILDGNGLDRVLQIHTGRTAEISALTVTGGLVMDDNGSGIENRGTLTLNDVTVRGNTLQSAYSYGGALSNAALAQDATAYVTRSLIADNTAPCCAGLQNATNNGLTAEVHVDHSTVSGNTATMFGGGIYNGFFEGWTGGAAILALTDSLIAANSTHGLGMGGGIYAIAWEAANSYAWLTLERTTVRDNSAINQPGDYGAQGAGVRIYDTTTTVLDSTISGNVGTGVGGMQPALGGGLAIWNSDVTLTNTTLSGNELMGQEGGSGDGGGISLVAAWAPASLTLLNVTLAENSAAGAGGAMTAAKFGDFAPVVTFKNALIGGNTAAADASCTSVDFGYGLPEFTSLGNNLEDYDLCEFDQPTDLPNTEGLLGPLQDNGGPTWTHALLTGSPAVNAGDDAAAPPADQRGVPRPQGPASDIGSFEAQALHLNKAKMNARPAARPGYYKIAWTGRIHDQEGLAAEGATVHGEYTYPDGSIHPKSGLTDRFGRVKLSVKEPQAGTYVFCLTGITQDGYVYDPAADDVDPCSTIVVGP